MSDQNSDPNTQSESCQGLRSWRKLMDVQPEKPPTDPECLLWYERVKCSRFDLLVPFFQAIFVLLDIGFDLKVAVMHYWRGDRNWAAYTVIIVVVSHIFVQAVSVFFFIEDKNDNSQKRDALKENGVEVKRCHLLLYGRFVRFYQMWKVARNIRRQRDTNIEDNEEARQKFIRRHSLYILQTADSNTLGLIEAFLENVPQVMLQLYMLAHEDLTSRDDQLLVTLNIVKSLLFFAFSHLSYTRSLRKQSKESGQLEWFSTGAVSLYLWRLFMLVSRTLVLALFASTFKGYFTVLLITVRFLVFLIIVGKQRCDYFKNNRIFKYLLKLAVAYIHIFSFFPLISNKTKKLGVVYYGITFVENTTILVLWVIFCERDQYKIVAVVVANVSFAVGLACLALYYRCFHPPIAQNKKDKQTTDRVSYHTSMTNRNSIVQTEEEIRFYYMYESNV